MQAIRGFFRFAAAQRTPVDTLIGHSRVDVRAVTGAIATAASAEALSLGYFLNRPNRIGISDRRRASRSQMPNQAMMAVESGTVIGYQ